MAQAMHVSCTIPDAQMAMMRRKLKSRHAAAPARRFLARWGTITVNRAKKNAPVDRGQLRASLTHEVDGAEFPRYARAGTNVAHGPFMEFGTGTQSDGPGGSGRRHWPPSTALEPWARRHGFGPGGGFLVARAIGKRGGLKPRRYLRTAVEDSQRQIPGLVFTFAREVEAAYVEAS